MNAKSLAALVVALSVSLAGCAVAPDPVRPGQTVQAAPRANASTSTPTPATRRDARRVLAVSYPGSAGQGVTVVSSAPPTVEQLPSGLWRITFAPASDPLPVTASR